MNLRHFFSRAQSSPHSSGLHDARGDVATLRSFAALARALTLVTFVTFTALGLAPLDVSAEANEADLTGSARGIELRVYSQVSPLEINRIHSWEVSLSDDNGPLTGASLSVTAGMPEHNHGMPTQPQVTTEIVPGRYLLEGVRFHMPGLWRLDAKVTRDGAAPVSILIDFTL